MRFQILSLLLLALLNACTSTVESDNSYTLYLVRHAEKESDGSRDPALTEAGKQRAEQLAIWLHDKNIQEIWSSDYHRTRDTAKPSLNRSGQELRIYEAGDLATLSRELLDQGQNALIVGHSNTTPELARLICDCSIEDMDESEYDRLIVISVVEGKTTVQTLQQNSIPQD